MRLCVVFDALRPIFPKSQRHCAAQHPRGELMNDAGTFVVPTFCHVFSYFGLGKCVFCSYRRTPPDFFVSLNATARRNTRAAN